MPPHSLDVSAITFDPIRQRLAAGFADGSIEQRSLITGNVTGQTLYVDDPVDSIAYIRHGKVLAVAHRHGGCAPRSFPTGHRR
jgi:hypothetical protein